MNMSNVSPQAQNGRFAAVEDPRREQAPRSARPRNRRLHARVGARGVASHLQTRDGSTPGLSVENISMGGLFVRSATAFAPGTPVLLQLVRSGLKRAIQLSGQVVSVVSPAEARERGSVAGMGIVLHGLDREMEPRLRVLVDDLAGIAPTARPAPAPRAPEGPAPGASLIAVAPVSDESAQAGRRVEELEAEIKHLRGELLRRNRTIGDLANRLAAFEKV